MRILLWWCVVVLALSSIHVTHAQKASKGGDIVIPLKKGAAVKVSGMGSTTVCPRSVQWSTFDSQRAMAADGSVYGVAGDEGSWRIQRCTHQGITWAVPMKNKPTITLDAAGNVYVVSPVRGARNVVQLRKLTAQGKVGWRANLSSNGKHLYVQARPGSADSAVYLSTGTDGVLTGASALGKGRPAISKYSAKGKRLWTTYVGQGQYTVPFDVDARGNVFAVASSQDGAGHLVKIGPTGTVLFDRKLVFKKGAPQAGVRAIRVDQRSGDPYLILKGAGENDYGAARLRTDGKPVWAQMARLKHEGGGGEEMFIGSGVVGDTLYVFQTYAFETYDNPDAFPDDQYELLALGFRVPDGRVKFAKSEWYSSLDVSDMSSLGAVFTLPGKIALPSSVSTSFKVGPDGKPKLPWLAPLPRPKGDYFATRKVSYYEDGHDKVTESEDVMTIRHTGKADLQVKANFVGANFSECLFLGTMKPAGPNTWTYSSPGGCVVTLIHSTDQISIAGNETCHTEWCGARATLEGTFPTASRKPAGTYEWPQY